jgi:release factor glutamine methyltransferase
LTTSGRLLAPAVDELRNAGIVSPRREAELILAAALSVRREALLIEPETAVSAAAATRFRRDVKRRAGQEPLAYITGHKEFMSLDLVITTDVLVPRPDSESLVETALVDLGGRRRRGSKLQVADVGTGSGAIGLAIAHYCPWTEVWAIDISPAATTVAAANAARLGLAGRFKVLAGDLLSAPELPNGLAFDLIVANLPYVPGPAIDGLEPTVALFEPRLALDGGENGLALIHRLIPQAAARLVRGGALGLECDPDQCTLIAQELAGAGFVGIQVTPDLAGLARNVWGTRCG